MLFNSIEFVIFFPLVTILYFLIPHRFRWVHLLAASCIFYAAFIPSYLLILFLLIGIDYTAGILIESSEHKKAWLTVSVIANVSLLAVFKYFNFFISNYNELTGSHHILLHWVLPIGLSFHTFQSLAYTIEVYYGRQKAIRHAGYYALYVMFYPQLVAGPIERPQHLLPQFFLKKEFSGQWLYQGLRLMAWGFFKKLVVADRIAKFSDAIFADPAQATTLQLWLAVFFFGIQIYADFSGYSDIAIGAARCMGIDLTTNFNRPYGSKNIRDFWRRWHISLSSWFRDYVYIPLGGNRKGRSRKHVNLLITFTLSGFWHGAGWTFIAWGLLHGLYVLAYDAWKRFTKNLRLPGILGWFITMVCVGFAWIFFRAVDMQNAWQVISGALHFEKLSFDRLLMIPGATIQFGNFTLFFSFLAIGYMFLVERVAWPKMENLDQKKFADVAILASSVLLIIFFGVFQKSSFIYFQF